MKERESNTKKQTIILLTIIAIAIILAATFTTYYAAPGRIHLVGVIGGAIWGLGMTFSLVAATTHFVGPAVSYAIGQGATMVSAAWGVFVWREFAGAPASARNLLAFMFLLFLVGLGMVAVAPLYV